MSYHMRISEAADFLGCSKQTVRKRIEEGLLEGKTYGPSMFSPIMIPTEQVMALVNTRRLMVVADNLAANRDTPDWNTQIREVIARAQALEKVIGREPILEVLSKFGVQRFHDLHPNQLRSMFGSLFRLAMLKAPYVRNQGFSVAEKGAERRRQQRSANREHPGQRGRPRMPTGSPEQEAAREKMRMKSATWNQRAGEALKREREARVNPPQPRRLDQTSVTRRNKQLAAKAHSDDLRARARDPWEIELAEQAAREKLLAELRRNRT